MGAVCVCADEIPRERAAGCGQGPVGIVIRLADDLDLRRLSQLKAVDPVQAIAVMAVAVSGGGADEAIPAVNIDGICTVVTGGRRRCRRACGGPGGCAGRRQRRRARRGSRRCTGGRIGGRIGGWYDAD